MSKLLIIFLMFLSCIIFFLIIMFYSLNFKKKENFVNIVQNKGIIDNLLNDNDDFFKNLTKYDLIARKYTSFDDYKNKVLKSFNFDPKNHPEIVQKLKYLTILADDKLRFKYPDISKIPWNIIFFEGTEYEDECPHVRFNTIFLPINKIQNINITDLTSFSPRISFTLNTLIHEKVHLFQKLYPNHVYNINFLRNYKKIMPRKEFQKKINKLVRSNPDLDDWIYSDSNDKLLYNEFKNENPTKLYDTLQRSQDEHPYEIMAYSIADELSK